jgi:hypothetical protein
VNWLLVRIQSYLSGASRGESKISPELVKEFQELCGKALNRQFNQKKDDWRFRMSEVGRPLCQQKLNKKGVKQEYEYNAVMRFIIGDLIEALAVVIMKAAGLKIQEFQKEVQTKIANITLKGTYDVKVEEKIYDIKTASPYAFDSKFGEFGGYNKMKEDDVFGYVAQGYSYAHGDNSKFGGWIAINKSTGEWAICEAPEEQEHEKLKSLHVVKYNIENIDSEFKPEFDDYAETYKPTSGSDKGIKKETGNRIMTYPCTFCGYKSHCWEDAIFAPKVTSRAKNPPYIWYTTLKNRELK